MTKRLFQPGLGFSRMVVLFCTFLLTMFTVGAQDKPKRETIQATAFGQQRASGKTFNVTINIESYSTPEDQKVLIDAFNTGGRDALEPKGRVAITGTLGYQISYIRSFPSETGRKIRLVTDRPIILGRLT